MLALWLVAARTYAQNFTNLSSFGGVFGNSPLYSILPGPGLILSGGTLYGTASFGGSEGYGMVFKVNTDGTGFTNLYNFDSVILYDPSTGLYDIAGDGVNPYAGLVLSGGTLYGTTQGGGTNSGILYGGGTVFAVSTNGTGFTTLYSFGPATYDDLTGLYFAKDGANPYANLILSGRMLYGTTSLGGTNGYGAMFGVRTNGTGFTTLYSFSATISDPFIGIYGTTTNSDGAEPCAGLILSGNTLYGATPFGGTNGNGTAFALTLPPITPIPLNIQLVGNAVVLSWTNPAFFLQAAPTVTGVYVDVTSATSPYTNVITGTQKFFRLSN